MGGGSYSNDDYYSKQSARKSAGVSDFEYTETATKVHPSLDAKRISKKPFGLLESRDSVEHPISTAIIVTFDVTGSNERNAKVAQKKLPELMAKLTAVCDNPQIAIWANDDVNTPVGVNAIQLGEFESDIRIDDTIRNIWITGDGGGNGGESYDLLIYAAAYKTITDSMEKRNKKGYMFLYADELFFPQVKVKDVKKIFGDSTLEVDISIEDIIKLAQQKWDIYMIYPKNCFHEAKKQYITLFGEDHVIALESPDALCDQIATIVADLEKKHSSEVQAVVQEDIFSREV